MLHFYELSLRNVGGLVMPVVVQLTYADKSTEVQTIPAEIWRKNNERVTKVIATQKPVISLREHNETRESGRLVGRMLAGENVALVSDAGQTIARAVKEPLLWIGLLLFGISALFWLVVLERALA